MVRKNKDDAGQSVSQARKKVKEINQRSKALLKRAELETREYRKQLSILKKQGVVSKRINAARHQPTRYMLSKIRKFKDVATGHALAVPVSKVREDIREEYIKRGTATARGGFFVVPKTTVTQKADVVKGHLATYSKLRKGEERVIFLPYRTADLNELVGLLRDEESAINQMKEPTEQFGFQIFGHNSLSGFPDAEHLANYIIERYSHILTNSRSSRHAMQDQNFVLIRFKHAKGQPISEPYKGEKLYTRRRHDQRKDDPRYYWENKMVREAAAARKRRQRKRETPEEYEARLNRQRDYDRSHANDRREQRMARKAFGEGGKKNGKRSRD